MITRPFRQLNHPTRAGQLTVFPQLLTNFVTSDIRAKPATSSLVLHSSSLLNLLVLPAEEGRLLWRFKYQVSTIMVSSLIV
jgi:hypothetical protein